VCLVLKIYWLYKIKMGVCVNDCIFVRHIFFFSMNLIHCCAGYKCYLGFSMRSLSVTINQVYSGQEGDMNVACDFGLCLKLCCEPLACPQSKFASRARAWSDENEAGAACSIRLRLERNPDLPPPGPLQPEVLVRRSLTQLFTDCLEAHVANVRLSLSITSLAGLADLLEDEILPKPVPMQVSSNLKTFKLLSEIDICSDIAKD
jgi:hypothetical protein